MSVVNVMERDWDFLIILDACRFDYFERIYGDYLEGALVKITSTGSTTIEWCKKTFHGKYSDVVYVSGNPYINSKTTVGGFTAKEHFSRIIDVWSYGWDEEYGTVHPKWVNETARRVSTELNRKIIVHYLQPHAPYLSASFRANGFIKPALKSSNVFLMEKLERLSDGNSKRVLYRCADSLGGALAKMRIINDEWTLREMFGMPPASPMDAVRRQFGMAGVRLGYEETLRIVLQHVQELCSYLLVKEPARKIVVTSDHGELLGENGAYSHKSGSRNPLLRDIPWFTVRKRFD